MFKKATMATLGVIALAVTSLTAAMPASATPQTISGASYISVSRSMVAGAITLAAGESTTLVFSGSTPNQTVFDGIKVLRDNAAVASQAGLSVMNAAYMWQINGCSSQQTPISTTTVVPCSTATYVNLQKYVDVTNTGSSTLTVQTNFNTAVLAYDGTSLASQSNSTFASKRYNQPNVPSSIPFSRTNGDTSLNAQFNLCIDSTRVTNGDSLTVVRSVLSGGAPVSETIGIGGYATWNSMNSGPLGSTVTYSSSSPQLMITLYANALQDGNVTASIDLQKGGTSVLTTCSGGGSNGPGTAIAYPGPLTLGSVAGDAAFTAPTVASNLNLLAGTVNLSADTSVRVSSDGAGGFIYGGAYLTDPTKYVITRLNATGGADSKFGASGKILVPTGTDSVGNIAWYSTKSKWALFTYSMGINPVTKITTGTFKSGTVVTKPVVFGTVCGTGWTATSVNALYSAQSASPLAAVSCSAAPSMKSVLVSIAPTTGKATKIVDLGAPATGLCARSQSSYNPAATGAGIALVFYVTTADCTDHTMNPTVVARSIVTVTASAKGATKVLSVSPWGSNSTDEPSNVFLAAGSKAGTWIGTAYRFGNLGMTALAPFKLSATGVFTFVHAIVDDSRAEFSSWTQYMPIKEISATKWIVEREGSATSIQAAALATLNPTTGATTTSKAVTYDTSAGNVWGARNILGFSLSTTTANFFGVTSSSKYSVSTWKLPTK